MTTRSVTSCTGDAEVSEEAIDRVVAQVAELSALFGVPPKKVEYYLFDSRDRLR